MHRFFYLWSAERAGDLAWEPDVDIYRTRDGWIVKADLAGVRKEDIEITADGRFLTICGVRRDWIREESCQYYSMEISYNRFRRSIRMPFELDPEHIVTEFRDGMLLIRIAEAETNG